MACSSQGPAPLDGIVLFWAPSWGGRSAQELHVAAASSQVRLPEEAASFTLKPSVIPESAQLRLAQFLASLLGGKLLVRGSPAFPFSPILTALSG